MIRPVFITNGFGVDVCTVSESFLGPQTSSPDCQTSNMGSNTPEVVEAGSSFLADEEASFKCTVIGCENKSFITKSALKYIPCDILVYAILTS